MITLTVTGPQSAEEREDCLINPMLAVDTTKGERYAVTCIWPEVLPLELVWPRLLDEARKLVRAAGYDTIEG
jgi:hypothetical protein